MAEKENFVEQALFLEENIPDPATLYYRVHRSYVRAGLRANIFRSQKGSMSTDWCRYSSAEAARLRAKTPADNGIVELNAGKLRKLASEIPSYNLELRHFPTQPNNAEGLAANQAHVNVHPINCQIEETEIRYKLWEICGKKWKIDVDEQVSDSVPPTCSG
jgi:hypothetical protein